MIVTVSEVTNNSCKALPILAAIEKMVDDLADTHLASDTPDATRFLIPTGPSACTVKACFVY